MNWAAMARLRGFEALLRPVQRGVLRIDWLTRSIEDLILLTDILLPL